MSGAARTVDVERLVNWALELQRAESVASAGHGHAGDSADLVAAAGAAGCIVKGGWNGGGRVHPDALAVVDGIDEYCGEAWRPVKEFGRLGIRPEWMQGVVPSYGPARWDPGFEGRRAMALLTDRRARWQGKLIGWRSIDFYDRQRHRIAEPRGYTPLALTPPPALVLAARDYYRLWWHGLAALRQGLVEDGGLAEYAPTGPAAPAEPWDGPSHAAWIAAAALAGVSAENV